MNAHFFEFSTLIKTEAKVWIVSKIKPSIPILKISQSDFNLIKRGVFAKTGERFKVGGSDYWFSKELSETLKIKAKKTGTSLSDLAFSLQEFMNPEIIEKLDFEVFNQNFSHLKNTKDHIYIICSKNTKKNSESLFKKLEEEFSKYGLIIEGYYYITETFYNRDEDDISFKKVRLVLQHLIGLKTDGDKFTNEEITTYENIDFYDDSNRTLFELEDINNTLKKIIKNSEEGIKRLVIDSANENKSLTINRITYNKVNKFVTKKIQLQASHVIKTFEGFRFR